MIQARIALISDVHYGTDGGDVDAERDPAQGLGLFRGAVALVNEEIRPDLTVLLGDLVETGGTSAGLDCLREIREAAAALHGPVLAIPGNHDPGPDLFYSIFDCPPGHMDVGELRLVPFIDPPAPEYNAVRTEAGLARMASETRGFSGPICAVQHVPVFPPGTAQCPFNYINAKEVVTAMRANGIGLSVSGHYHRGAQYHTVGLFSIAVPALCNPPYPVSVLVAAEGWVSLQLERVRG